MSERRTPPEDIAPQDFFLRWVPEAVAADAERRGRLGDSDAVLEFHLLGDGGGVYTLVVEEGFVRGHDGQLERVDLRIRLDVETWRALNAGSLSAPEAFLRRRVSLEGNLRLAVKLHLLLS